MKDDKGCPGAAFLGRGAAICPWPPNAEKVYLSLALSVHNACCYSLLSAKRGRVPGTARRESTLSKHFLPSAEQARGNLMVRTQN